MSHILRSVVLALFLGALIGGPALAKNEGQEDLDKATQLKLNAKTLTDLGEVIRLCESALKKGLDAENAKFANELLSATRIQRGAVVTKMIFDNPGDAKWGDYRRLALDDLEKAVKLDANQAEAFFRIAQLNLLPGGDAKRAAEALDQSIKVNKEEPLMKAQALLLRSTLQKDPKKKLADLDEAAQSAPGDPSPLRGRAMLYLQQEKYAEAVADFDAALKLAPDHVPTIEAKANAQARMKKYDEALKTVEQARKLEPKSLSPLVERARIHSMKGDHQAALKDLDEVDKIAPDNPAVLLLRAGVYEELDETDKAMADIDRAIKLNPNLALALRFRASLLASEGKFGEAIQQLEELLTKAKESEDVETRMQLAMLYTADRKHQKALDIFSDILKKDPDNWQAFRGRGDTYLGIGKHAEAIADYEKAIKIKPDDSGILNNFAWVLCTSPVDKLRNGKRAIEMAEKACKVTDYKQAHILSTLGAAYAETGDFETAKKWSQKAIETGREDQKADLKKELASYLAKKPIRELKTGNEPEEPIKPRKHRKSKPGDTKPKLTPSPDDEVL